MSTIMVLGAGMVGSAIAIDLSKDHDITVADRSNEALGQLQLKNRELTTQCLDVTDKTILQNAIAPFDLVVCAVPGFLGFQTLKASIEAGKNVVDISFFPENALELDALAKANKVTVIVDCGVAPGMDNLILGYYDTIMEITHFECLVGGLPKTRIWPFCYKAPFSPVDVIEEYTRPARYVEQGNLMVREPLTDCEFVAFDHVGTLEAFNSDGLRSLIYTLPHIPNMKEKTLRYPGHAEYVNVLKQSGFFSDKEIDINGHMITPLAFTSRVLFKEWKLDKTEEELTIMRVGVTGKNKAGVVEEITYNLYDEYCVKTHTSSMARCTGYTATAAANMFLEGLFVEKGVFPPELIGRHHNCFHYIMTYLNDRDIRYIKTSEVL